MRSIATVTAALATGAAAALALTATPAFADTAPSALSSMQVTIAPALSTGPIIGTKPSLSATLLCDPAGGTHPVAAKACSQIADVGGNIAAIAPLEGYGCLGVWDPVQISVTGTWRGKVISFKQIQSNVGCARISHGYVFFI